MFSLFKPVLAATALFTMTGCVDLDDAPTGPAGKGKGEVSAIPAFTGGGNNWSLNFNATGKDKYSATMTLPGSSQQWVGMLNGKSQPADASSGTTVLSGEMRATPAVLPVTVEITRGECSTGNRPGNARVSLYAEGEAPLRGCGSVATY
ncbi:hypothetical protein [Paracoccus pacificus]|uniref:Lipoprotein n=1 Tax=Paracoccus pacificus TaxID=1463598 RepID=A0ABW4RA86_9RHOB